MTLHPHLSLVITQGTPRGALISGHIIYQAASFTCTLCCAEHCAGSGVQSSLRKHGRRSAEGPLQGSN